MSAVPLTETELYLHEISKIQASLENLLVNLSSAVCKLPDNRDHKDLVNEIITIKENLQNVSTEIHGFLNKTNDETFFLTNNFEKLLEEIRDLIDKFDGLSVDEYKKHINVSKSNYNLLNDKINTDIIGLQSKIKIIDDVLSDIKNNVVKIISHVKNIEDFIISLNKMYEKMSNKYESDIFTPNDIQIIVEMARRNDAIFKIWTPRRKAIVWIFGIIFTGISFISGITSLITFVSEIFH